MTQEGGTPLDFWARIQKMIDDAVAGLARSGMLRNASISDGGLTIKGGFLRLLTKAVGGIEQFYIGPTGEILGNGEYQQFLRVRRADGSTVLRLWDAFPDADGTLNQALSWLDRLGNVVVADDTDGGMGIARPYLPAVFYPSRSSDFPSTNSAAFGAIHRAMMTKQQPKLFVSVWGFNDTAGATGEIRVMVNGVQLGSTVTTGNTAVTQYNFGPAVVAGDYMQELWVEIQARLVTGTGVVRVGAAWVDGRQT